MNVTLASYQDLLTCAALFTSIGQVVAVSKPVQAVVRLRDGGSSYREDLTRIDYSGGSEDDSMLTI